MTPSILRDEKKTARLIFLVISILFVSAIVVRQLHGVGGHLITSDGRGYFVHLPSILLGGDIDYYEEMSYLGLPIRNQWTIGTAIAWLPFYLVGLLVTRAGVALGQPWPLNGMAPPEQLLCCCGTIIYGAAAVALSYRLACRWFCPRWSFLGTALFFCASNLPYYLLVEPYMSHGVSAFWVALLLYVSIKEEPLTHKEWAAVGLLAGVAALTRVQDGLFLAVPFLWHILKSRSWKELMIAIALTGVISGALFSVQVAIWNHGLQLEQMQRVQETEKTVTSIEKGSKPKTKYYTGGRLNWSRPRFGVVLFSSWCGLLAWHPIYALCWLGLILLLGKKPRVAAVFLFGTLIQAYVIAVWGGQGQTFGGRMFLCAFSSFNLGMVALLSEHGKRMRIFSVLVGSVLVCEALFVLVRHRIEAHSSNINPLIHELLYL